MGTMLRTGIIGEGKMGSSLFDYLSGFDIPLTWVQSSHADTDKARQTYEKKVGRSLRFGLISAGEQELRLRNIITRDPECLAGCDLIIEAIPEDIQQKQELFRTLDQIAGPDCIFASNSSSILPSRITPSENRRSRAIGMHFFYPVKMKDIVEVVLQESTDYAVIDTIRAFLDGIKRKYLLQPPSEAFILNRIFLEFQQEAFDIVQEGILTENMIDDLVRSHFFPHGVFDFFDSVGIDVILPSVRNYQALHPDPSRYSSLVRRLEGLAHSGKLGLKTGEGFYRYEGGHASAPEPGIPFPTLDTDRIAARLGNSIERAFRMFHHDLYYTEHDLRTALKEYFGGNED